MGHVGSLTTWCKSQRTRVNRNPYLKVGCYLWGLLPVSMGLEEPEATGCADEQEQGD